MKKKRLPKVILVMENYWVLQQEVRGYVIKNIEDFGNFEFG